MRRAFASLSLLLAATAAPAAAQTRAGTAIANTADARWTAAGKAEGARSNTDRLIVAERLDLTLVAGEPRGGDAPPAFVLTNTGTGSEAFVATAVAPAGQPLPLAIDRDGDGRYDPAVDRLLPDGRVPALAPGEHAAILVLAPVENALRLRVRAETGSGTPGTVFAGQGDGGSDAVVGATGATATLSTIANPVGSAQNSLVKSQTVAAPDGSDRPMSGATVTYSLAAAFAGAAREAMIEDALPVGTRFVAGSLRLDGQPLSDGADTDPGEVAARTVRVRLGDLAAGAAHTVSFAVILP
jgi:hypothetical protein